VPLQPLIFAGTRTGYRTTARLDIDAGMAVTLRCRWTGSCGVTYPNAWPLEIRYFRHAEIQPELTFNGRRQPFPLTRVWLPGQR
jgi:hypothetical protein